MPLYSQELSTINGHQRGLTSIQRARRELRDELAALERAGEGTAGEGEEIAWPSAAVRPI